MSACECPPCPGRGNDGHGLTHCAECCMGTGVEADWDCPVHGIESVTPRALRAALVVAAFDVAAVGAVVWAVMGRG